MSQHEYSVDLARPRSKEEMEQLAKEWLEKKEQEAIDNEPNSE
jgi:hypothetical protein